MRNGKHRALVRRFGRDDRGIAAIFAAGFGFCLIATLAVAIDVASFSLARRNDQGALDLASIAAASTLPTAETTARAVLADNHHASPQSLKVTTGRYDPDVRTAAAKRFVANGAPANAVLLEMTTIAPVYFSKALLGGRTPTLSTRSIAANTRVAAFSIGSRLASLNGGIANAVLSRMLGASLSLSVMDYDALADANIDMPDLLSRLAPKVGVTAGTYDEVLSAKPTLTQLVQAIDEQPGLNSATRAALSRVVATKAGSRVDLRQMVSMGPFAKLGVGSSTGVTAAASALDVLSTAIGIANGKNQVDVDLGAQVPGLLGLTLSIVIGERPQTSPWLAMGAESVTVSTAQTRVRLNAKVGGAAGLPSLNLPVAVDIAAASAKLTAAKCGRNPRADGQVTLDVTPSIAELWVGEPKNLAAWKDFSAAPDIKPAKVVDALLLAATASSHVAATNMRPKSVTFSAGDIASRTVKTVETTNMAQTTLTSLTEDLTVQVDLGILGVSLGTPSAVTKTLSAILKPVGATLDPAINKVLDLAGVGLGEADVTVRGLRCDGSALVN